MWISELSSVNTQDWLILDRSCSDKWVAMDLTLCLIGSSQRKRFNERPHWNLQIKPTKLVKGDALMMQCCVTEGMGHKQLWPQLCRKRILKSENKLTKPTTTKVWFYLLEIKGMLHYCSYPRQPSEYSFILDPKLTISHGHSIQLCRLN